MILKLAGIIVFLFVIIKEKMYYSLGWWDLVSFLIVVLGSIFVWIVYFFLKRERDFIVGNISVILGIGYGFIWGIVLLVSGNSALIFPLVTIPVGYGLITSAISDYIYARGHRDAGKAD